MAYCAGLACSRERDPAPEYGPLTEGGLKLHRAADGGETIAEIGKARAAGGVLQGVRAGEGDGRLDLGRITANTRAYIGPPMQASAKPGSDSTYDQPNAPDVRSIRRTKCARPTLFRLAQGDQPTWPPSSRRLLSFHAAAAHASDSPRSPATRSAIQRG